MTPGSGATFAPDLDRKVALITGGSRGLGLEIADALAAAGADVVIASRKQEACDAVAEKLNFAHGVRTIPVACNVSDWTQCDALVELAYEAFGQVDILVNDAGISPVYPSLADVSRELFDKVIGVNLAGPFRLSALIGPRMAAGAGG